ncbi:MAG: lysylphosphatidylglycerol synthase transmembrane domain-containing protein, partial [Pseudomonadota bacterium]
VGERLLVSYRWHLILVAGGAKITYWSATRLLFVSQAAGSIMFGELSRNAVMLAGLVKSGSDTALGVSSILVERLLAFVVLLTMVTVGISFAPPLMPDSITTIAWSIAGLVALGAIGLVLAAKLDRVSALLRRTRMDRAANWFSRLRVLLNEYRGKTRLLAYNTILAFGVQFLRVVQTAMVATAIGLDLPFVYLIIFVPIISAATQIPASAGGIGVREVAHVLLLGTIGVEAESAFAVSILTWFVRLGLSLIGFVIYMRYGFGVK